MQAITAPSKTEEQKSIASIFPWPSLPDCQSAHRTTVVRQAQVHIALFIFSYRPFFLKLRVVVRCTASQIAPSLGLFLRRQALPLPRQGLTKGQVLIPQQMQSFVANSASKERFLPGAAASPCHTDPAERIDRFGKRSPGRQGATQPGRGLDFCRPSRR